MNSKHSKENREENEKPRIQITDRRSSTLSETESSKLETAQVEERLPTYVQQLKQEAEDKDKRLREYIAAFKEKSTESDEIRSRLQRDNENRLDQLKANLFARLVPILDNLNRAAQAAKSNSDFDSLKQGIEMVISQFIRELKDNDVHVINTRQRKFDPKTDEAYMTVDTDDPEQDNMIVEELEPGYMHKDKLIKAAKVKVAKLKQ